MFEIEKRMVQNAFDGNVYHLLQETGCILAGGAITSIFCGREVNDWDIYMTSKDAMGKILSEIYGVSSEEILGSFELQSNFATERSLMCIDKGTEAKTQFIHYKIHPDAESIFQSFDFVSVMGAYDFKTEEFILHPEFMKDNAQRTLTFNKNTDFPIVSMLRVDKYKQRGYKISKAQMLRVAFACTAKNYDSWETVLSEIGGLYGVAPKDLFDTTKEFSLESVIDQLEQANVKEKFNYSSHPTFEQVVELTRGSCTEDFLSWYDSLSLPESRKDEFWYSPMKQNLAERNKYEWKAEKPTTLTDFFAGCKPFVEALPPVEIPVAIPLPLGQPMWLP